MYKCIYTLKNFICCKWYYKNNYWYQEDQNDLITYINTGYDIDTIASIMNKERYVIEQKVIDTISDYSKVNNPIHTGPGHNYENYLNYIRRVSDYTEL